MRQYLFMALSLSICMSAQLPNKALAAVEEVAVACAGPTSLVVIKSRKEEFEKKYGIKLTLTTPPTEQAIRSMVDKRADAVISGRSLEDGMNDAAAKGMPKQNIADFVEARVATAYVRAVLNPENSVTSLSKQQLSDLISGKVKSWKEIGGNDTPVKVVVATKFVAIISQLSKIYSPKISEATKVVDESGVIRAVKQDPGAIGFLSQELSEGGFKPKYLPTEVTLSTIMIASKNAKPVVLKIMDDLKVK